MKNWKLVQELFEEALGLAENERASFLAQRTDGDSEITQQVEQLLSADANPRQGFSNTATDLLLAIRKEPSPDGLCGTSFGAYRIEAHISSGGMGHVYRALRTSAGTQRRVALKVLRPGLDSEPFLQRFQEERRTLAALEHESIVSFIDAGCLPDGRPYMVMEFVEGTSLSQWAAGVSVHERLVVFLQVLAAVQYAHQQLVVHRDLKPSNVLVTPEGSPKLLDFGVASALKTEVGDQLEPAPLTASYASPEQRRGASATTISDVYSLGVLLQEVLSGELPRSEGQNKVHQDLQAIATKASHQDPDQRYDSVTQFADDIRRYLKQEPVVARNSRWTRHGALFVLRHRLAVTIAAAVVLVVCTGWIASELGRRRAQREAGAGWGAHGEAKAAAQVFESWIVETVEGNSELTSSAIQHMEQALNSRLIQCPEADVLVRLRLAELYAARGEVQRALDNAKHAWDLAQSTVGVGRKDKQWAETLMARLSAQLEANGSQL
ncbi:MAG: serine/threonine protein kinase [Candidatus Paceibacteria bacterium]|jgi:serine/threonine protein kinase